MPTSLTKNKQDHTTLAKMVQAAFPDREIGELRELTEGYFNVAYLITLSDGTETILKIAPSPESEVMTHEINIMFSEADAMRKVRASTKVPVPEVYYYDDSRSLCGSDYFFMEKLRGSSFSSQMERLTVEQKNHIYFQMGQYTAQINRLSGDRFGYYGQPQKQNPNWYAAFQDMLSDTYRDAARKNISIPVPQEKLFSLLEHNKAAFGPVTKPKLVHWDIWAGNVFVAGDAVTGLIDFERCLWADPLMEVGFRTYQFEQAFFNGYGIPALNEEKQLRAKWYDIYLFLISCLECGYRDYGNDDTYYWGTKMLLEWTEAMENRFI